MKRAAIKALAIVSLFLLCVLEVVMPTPARSDTCSDGAGVPPFLGGEKIQHNLLLMIDNSRSMYDLKYVEDLSSCFDDSFTPATQKYAGYFLTIEEYVADAEVWYEYDMEFSSAGKFTRTSTKAADCDTANASLIGTLTGATKVQYSTDEVCTIMNETYLPAPAPAGSLDKQEVLYFAATGKFLNWLVSSKMDLQKLVLTGGRVVEVDPDGTPDNDDEYLAIVPESRGCNEQKMIKEITVNKVGSVINPAAKLTLAVRSDGLDGDDDSGEGLINDTFIDIYGATQGGFNNESCETALGKFLAGGAPGTWKGDLDECLGLDKVADDELVSVYNEATQECWQVLGMGGPPPGGTWRLTDVAGTKNNCETFYLGGKGAPSKITKVDPWELASQGGTSVTGAFCNGKFDDPSISPNFVGRCWLPPGTTHSIPIAAKEEPHASSLIAQGSSRETNQVPLSGNKRVLPTGKSIEDEAPVSTQDWSGYRVSAAADSGAGLQQENTEAVMTAATPQPPGEFSQERMGVIRALKEFISTNGSNYARSKVLRAVKEFFVAEANAAYTFDIEESAATCSGSYNIVGGALGGNAYEYTASGQTCDFNASTLAVPYHAYYKVYIKAPCARNATKRVADVPLTITHAGGSTALTFDQQDQCGDWVELTGGGGPGGTFEFSGDGSGRVRLTTNPTSPPQTYVYADAVRYELYQYYEPPCTLSTDGLYIESEDYTGLGTYFDVSEDDTMASGGKYIYSNVRTATENYPDRTLPIDSGNSPMQYSVNFPAAGTYDIWFLMKDNTPTPTLGVATDHNSFWYGLDGTVQGNVTKTPPDPDSWSWSNTPHDTGTYGPRTTLEVPSAGPQTVNIWFREHNVALDGFFLSNIPSQAVPNECTPVSNLPPELIESCAPGTYTAPDDEGIWICDDCVEQAVLDFCNDQLGSDVIDPSNPLDTEELGDYLVGDGYTNAPGLWWFGAVEGQLGVPLLSMSSRVEVGSDPEGLLDIYDTALRMGVMRFRSLGELSECGDYGMFQNCTTDGAQVVTPIGIGTDHMQTVINTINETDAATWTPLAEAMFTAIGYYTQDPDMRLNNITDYPLNSDVDTTGLLGWENDHTYGIGSRVIETIVNSAGVPQDIVYEAILVGTSGKSKGTSIHDDQGVTWQLVNDPVIAHCQRNYVLPITEGMSTADLNAEVVSFVQSDPNHRDPDDDDVGTAKAGANPSQGCDALRGSTYFDDLVYYAWHGSGIYKYEPWQEDDDAGNPIKQKNNIELHMVDTRSARDDLTGECLPSEMLVNVSQNTNPVKFVDINKDDAYDVDTDGDGVADSDWPLYFAGDPEKLYDSLDETFSLLSEQSASGSAASVVSASGSGEGAIYQALFWPDTRTNLGVGNPEFVEWTGQVHALFVDVNGNLREDTNRNGALDAADQQVILGFDKNARTTKACYGTFNPDTGCSVPTEDLYKVKYIWNAADWLNNPRFEIADTVGENRVSFTADQTGYDATPRRYIFTWNDLDNNGVVGSNEVLPFTEYLGTGGPGFPTVTAADRGPVPVDFGIDPADDDAAQKVNRIINWIRGEDQPEVTAGVSGATLLAMRNRKMRVDMDLNDIPETNVFWKLGDIIHSTPMTVARPAENYNLLYRDVSYAQFARRWVNRRHMVYFGANDGMLHAVNSGFFDVDNQKFCRDMDYEDANNNGVLDGGEDLNGNGLLDNGPVCPDNVSGTAVLGQEMWAYVPYNLLPHLSCLTDPGYEHKYYVDLRPRIFDVRIFDEEPECDPDNYSPPDNLAYRKPGCIHPNGWGTILVGGMRFGGAKVRPDYPDDNREFTSAYFIFDITNPEENPTLLGEFTRTIDNTIVSDLDGDGADDNSPEVDLGYTLAIPTVVPMNDGTDTTWYLILGSGPTAHDPAVNALEGTSDKNARLAVIPLHDRMNPTLSGNGLKSLRIPAAVPVNDDLSADPNSDFGTIYVSDSDDSFISDLITVDLETQPEYKADVVYFGTVSGDWTDSFGTEGWSGRLNRLVTRNPGIIASATDQVVSRPYEWPTLLSGYSLTNPNVLYDPDPGQPIVSAPTVGTDGRDFWVYFGTGRFFDVADNTDSGSNDVQTYYGIREPIDCTGASFGGMNWKTVTNVVPTTPPTEMSPVPARGDIGLLPVEDIAIQLIETFASKKYPGVVGCYDDNGDFDRSNLEDCLLTLPDNHPLETTGSFENLVQYIVGDDVFCNNGTSPGFDGWSKDMISFKERNLGQASLLSELLSYSSYIPSVDMCSPEGSGYLYGVYYQTGTAWYKDVFGRSPANYNKPIETRIFLGAGLSTTPNIHVGQEEGGKVLIQTSVGQIVEIPQPNLPGKDITPGRIKWLDVE